MEIPYLTADQMREVDRLMVEEAGIGLLQMMENAGRSLAELARTRFLGGDARGRRVVVLAGAGGNGGGALVAARRLHGWGAEVVVRTTRTLHEAAGATARQLAALDAMGVPWALMDEIADTGPADTGPYDLVIDGVLGYGLSGDPTGPAAAAVRWANRSPAPTLALDVPSGLDATTGEVGDPCVTAAATMTLALPKTGLCVPEASAQVGELHLADIGVPSSVYRAPSLRLEVPVLFARSDIVRIG